MRSYFYLLFLTFAFAPASVQAFQSKDEDLRLDEDGSYLDYTWEVSVKSGGTVTSDVCGNLAEFSWKQLYKETPDYSRYIQAQSIVPPPIPEFSLELKLGDKDYQTGFISAFLKRKTGDYVGMRILSGQPFCSQAFKAKKIWGLEMSILFVNYEGETDIRRFHFAFQDDQPADVYEVHGFW